MPEAHWLAVKGQGRREQGTKGGTGVRYNQQRPATADQKAIPCRESKVSAVAEWAFA
jgi:hypothetical protein